MAQDKRRSGEYAMGEAMNSEVELPEWDPLLENEDVEQTRFRTQRSKYCRLSQWLPRSIMIFVCLVLLVDNTRLRLTHRSESSFDTDLSAAKHISELVQQRFTGGIQVNSQGKLYREIDHSQPQYVGEPSPEIDKAWDDLLSPVDLNITFSDLHGERESSVPTADGKGVLISLDVYHSLHCLDMVRRAIDFRYYFPTGQVPYFYRPHLDHCVDYLRQTIQCQSDLSPLTYSKVGPKGKIIPVFETLHTCRNFSKVHEWAMQRRNHVGGHGEHGGGQ